MGSFFSRKSKVPKENVKLNFVEYFLDELDLTNHNRKFNNNINNNETKPRTRPRHSFGGSRRSKKHSSRKTKRTRRR